MANDKQDKELRTRAEILREQVNVLLSRGKYTEASTAIFRELLKARRDGIADADRYAKAPND